MNSNANPLQFQKRIRTNTGWWSRVSPALEHYALKQKLLELGRPVPGLDLWSVRAQQPPGEQQYRPMFALACGSTCFGSLMLLVDIDPHERTLGRVWLAAGTHVLGEIRPWMDFRLGFEPGKSDVVTLANLRTSGWESDGPTDYFDNVLLVPPQTGTDGWLKYWLSDACPRLRNGQPAESAGDGVRYMLTSPPPVLVAGATHVVRVDYERPDDLTWSIAGKRHTRPPFTIDTAKVTRWILRIEQ
jgi:hypothetical protein